MSDPVQKPSSTMKRSPGPLIGLTQTGNYPSQHNSNIVTSPSKRRVWVFRPGSNPTSVFVSESDLVDDLKVLVLHKYPTSLATICDAADLLISICQQSRAVRSPDGQGSLRRRRETRHLKDDKTERKADSRTDSRADGREKLMDGRSDNRVETRPDGESRDSNSPSHCKSPSQKPISRTSSRSSSRNFEIILPPEANVWRILDLYYPNGMSVNEALMITAPDIADSHTVINSTSVARISYPAKSVTPGNNPSVSASLTPLMPPSPGYFPLVTDEHSFPDLTISEPTLSSTSPVITPGVSALPSPSGILLLPRQKRDFVNQVPQKLPLSINPSSLKSDSALNLRISQANGSLDSISQDISLPIPANLGSSDLQYTTVARKPLPPTPKNITPSEIEARIEARLDTTRMENIRLEKPVTPPKNRELVGDLSRSSSGSVPVTSSPSSIPVASPKKKMLKIPRHLPLMEKQPEDIPKYEGIVPQINVLIVEDNVINQKILERYMRRRKIRASSARTGADAIEMWRQGGFHLVLMDIQLPVMSGLEATKEIRRLENANRIGVFSSNDKPGEALKMEDKLDPKLFRSPVIIVALTASSSLHDKSEALAAGCNDFLTKPVNLSWLEQKTIEWGCMQALIDYEGWRHWTGRDGNVTVGRTKSLPRNKSRSSSKTRKPTGLKPLTKRKPSANGQKEEINVASVAYEPTETFSPINRPPAGLAMTNTGMSATSAIVVPPSALSAALPQALTSASRGRIL